MKREALLKQLAEQEFAAHEIALFLDTHPNNREALEAFEQYRTEAERLRKEYSAECGMLTQFCKNKGDTWSWVNNPWPWD